MDLLAEIDALVDVGRRAPGSDAERRAARYLERRLEELGRAVEIEPVDLWPAWPPGYALLAALGVVGSVLSVSAAVAGAALALVAALLTFLDAGLLLPTVRRALGRRSSQNVVSWGAGDKPGALVLVAHYDAGRGGLAKSERAQARWAALGRLTRRPAGGLELLFWAEVAVLVCCLLRLPGLGGTALTAVQFVPTVLLIAAIALLLDIALSGTKGGENDNASGAALALSLAEGFGRGGDGALAHFDLHVLFTGSQKAVGAGMRSFLARHCHRLDSERTVFLNLDEVGAGGVCYTRREGALLAIRSHLQLVELCDEVGARAIVNRTASDGYAARSAGLPAITISCRDERGGAAAALVEEDALERAGRFCVELIERLDAEVGPDLARPAPALSEAEET